MTDIAGGRYAVGGVLPSEIELAKLFGVSRFTIREALRRLEESGLVQRRKRVGTKVVVSKPVPRYSLALQTTDQLLKYLGETSLHVSSVRRVSAEELLAHEPASAGEPWWKVETYRTLPDAAVPISWTDIFIHDDYSAILNHIGARPGPTFSLLEEVCGEVVHRIRQELSGIGLPPRVAAWLRVEPGRPALRVVRRFFNPADRLLELAVSYYPEGQFTYETELIRRNVLS